LNEIQKKKVKSKNLQKEGEILLNNAKTKNDYLKAKEKFDEAWKTYNNEKSLQKKIIETECWINIKNGEDYFNSKEYIKASNEYNKALTLAKSGNLTNLINKSNDLLLISKNEIIKSENEKMQKIKMEEINKKKAEAEKLFRSQRAMEEEKKRIEELNRKRLLEQQKEFERKKKEEEMKILKDKKEKELLEKKEKEKKVEEANKYLEMEANNLIFNEKNKLKIKLFCDKNYLDNVKNYINSKI
jgi:hypothetical protein